MSKCYAVCSWQVYRSPSTLRAELLRYKALDANLPNGEAAISSARPAAQQLFIPDMISRRSSGRYTAVSLSPSWRSIKNCLDISPCCPNGTCRWTNSNCAAQIGQLARRFASEPLLLPQRQVPLLLLDLKSQSAAILCKPSTQSTAALDGILIRELARSSRANSSMQGWGAGMHASPATRGLQAGPQAGILPFAKAAPDKANPCPPTQLFKKE